MPDRFDDFLEAIDHYDLDDALNDTPEVQSILEHARKFGMNLLESIQDKLANKTKPANPTLQPPKPPALTRTLAETAFVERDCSTLNEVTKPDLEEHITFSQVIKDMTYGVRDLSVTAKYKDRDHNQQFGIRVGDKMGLEYKKFVGNTTYEYSLEHNLYNGRTRGSYYIENPQNSYGASIYQRGGNFGATLSYSNRNGFSAAISGDKESISASVGYSHKYKDCKLNVKGFVSTQTRGLDDFYNRNSSCVVGICGNITL